MNIRLLSFAGEQSKTPSQHLTHQDRHIHCDTSAGINLSIWHFVSFTHFAYQLMDWEDMGVWAPFIFCFHASENKPRMQFLRGDQKGFRQPFTPGFSA